MGNEELNKKLLEFAGIVRVDMGKNLLPKWHFEDETRDLWFDYPPYFPESLDAIFKWLVPKLDRGLQITQNIDGWECDIGLGDITVETEGINMETLALALCLAIEQLIDRGNNVPVLSE